ncbi:MAG: HAD family hydrolase [Dissulfurispiraceae bacterium]
MTIELIIFDLDGTLVDSSIDITNAINYAIAPFGVKPVTVTDAKGLVGEGITKLLERLVDRGQGSGEIARKSMDKDVLGARFIDYYSAHLTDNTTVYPGGRETLEELKGYKKAVISNKRESFSIKILEELDLFKYIDLVVGSETTPERKPSPIPVFYVLSQLQVTPAKAVIVGDSNYDIEAGNAAGINAIGVTYGFRSVDFLRGADFIINSIDELTPLVRYVM